MVGGARIGMWRSRSALPAYRAQPPVRPKRRLQMRCVEDKSLLARQRAQVLQTQLILPRKQCGTHRSVPPHGRKKRQRILNTHRRRVRRAIPGVKPMQGTYAATRFALGVRGLGSDRV